MANTRRRVKLYVLNEDRQWDDRGTGHVSSSYIERLQGMSLMVRAEEDGKILLESKIQPHTAYQKQQDTLIVWSEGDNYDLALSFQEKAGCNEIWEKICQIQGKDPSVTLTQDIPEEDDSDERFEDVPDAAAPMELPACELSRLEEISEVFASVLPSPIRREKLALAIEQENYIRKLVDLFHMCENLENLEGLHHLYEIFKTVFLLNKNSLFEIMFSDDMIFDIVGCLEYDPGQPVQQKHRQFLKEQANFKEIIPITSTELLGKIHQTYRVQYIQDIVLPTPSVFEENMLSTLSSFIMFNKVEIVNLIQDDDKFLADLFLQLTDENLEAEKRLGLANFLRELCIFSQTLLHQTRDEFFKTLASHGLLNALEILLGADEIAVKEAALEIFTNVVEVSPTMIREFILQESCQHDEDLMLINQVIDQMVCGGDSSSAVQLTQLIRVILDPENMSLSANKMEKSEFLSFFYKHCMHLLTAPLMAATSGEKPSKDDYSSSVTLGHILELLTFCVEHHTYHIKNYVISKDLLRRVLVLMKSKHKFVALAALRFCRRIVGLKDEFYNRYIVKGKLFLPIVEAFKQNGHRYNLLDSAVVELFEFIRMEDTKSLIRYIVEEHITDLKDVEYVPTFKGLLLRIEQEKDRQENKLVEKNNAIPNHGIIHVNSRYRRDARSMEEEEESWFDQEEKEDNGEEAVDLENDILNDDFKTRKTFLNDSKVNKVITDESKPVIANKALVGLVDYPDDDEEEEEEMSPAKRQKIDTS